jgi:hypothetical protein
MDNFHLSLPQTFLLLPIIGGEREKNLSAALLLPTPPDASIYQSAANIAWS